MAIKAHEFDGTQWAQGLWPVTALVGSEAYFITTLGDQWRNHGRQQGFVERIVIDQTDKAPGSALADLHSALSLFADQRLVELRLQRAVLDGVLRDTLTAWINNPPAEKRLLILGDGLNKTELKQPWVSTLERSRHWIEAAAPPASGFAKWLQGRLRAESIHLTDEATQALLAHTNGHLLAAQQVLERLKLIQPTLLDSNTVSLDQVMAVVTQSARYSVYDVVDSALQGDIGAVYRMLDILQAEGVEAMSLLWAATRDIELLSQLSFRVTQGGSVGQALNELRVWRSRESVFKTALNRLSLIDIRRLQSLALEIDRTIKGASKEPPWLMLKDLLLGLSGHGLRH